MTGRRTARSILVPLDGDLYLAGLDGNVRRITNTPETELDAQSRAPAAISPSSATRISTSSMPTAGGEQPADQDGGGDGSWGSAEFVAQEEMKRDTGHWWSPDDRYSPSPGSTRAPVHIVTRTAIGADGTRVYEQRYPAAGTPNARVELYVMAAGRHRAGSRSISAPDPDIYLARVDWTRGRQRPARPAREPRPETARPAPRRSRDRASTILFSETSRHLAQPARQSAAAARRQPDLDLRALRLFASSTASDRGRWTQLTHRRLGGARPSPASISSAAGSISPAIATAPLEQHLYWVDSRTGRARRAG